MKLNATYIKTRDKWWGLPLFLPSLILPIFGHINTFAHISSGEVFLFYLPLALMISMMMFFSWAALPGIALGIFVRKYAELGFYETLSLKMCIRDSSNFVHSVNMRFRKPDTQRAIRLFYVACGFSSPHSLH